MISENNKRIAKNTLMLYIRQILTLFVGLYTVRIVLDVLGAEDYGIYSVIGGIVLLFSFLKNTMASATQRFFSFAIGENNLDRLNKTFTVNLVIYGGIAILAILLLETIGLWYVREKLIVPPERFESAIFLFHFSVLGFIATIFSAPFMSIIIAHEDMKIYAYMSIAEVLLKLGTIFLLFFLPRDKLELYGILVSGVSIIITIIYISICIKKYIECQFFKFYWDLKLLNEIIGFTGWTMFGAVTTVVRKQGVVILLNQLFNPVVVAAMAIATNVSSQINLFSSNFNMGLYPPIIKSYAANNKQEMFSLVFNGSKITFFLMWVFALPMFLEMEAILQLWLKEIPPYTVLFARLSLVEALIMSISYPIATAARAPGRMKLYELTLGCIQLLIFVASWIVLKMGAEAYFVFVVAIVANLIMFIVRLLIVKKLVKLPIISYFYEVCLPVLGLVLVSVIPSVLVHVLLPKGFIFTSLSVILSVVFASISMYYIGLNAIMRNKVSLVIKEKINKLI